MPQPAEAGARPGGWRRSTWRAVAEMAIAVALVVADIHGLVPFSKTPFYLALGWASLRLRGVGWRGVGFILPKAWPRALAIGTLAGIAMELLSAFASQPLLEHLLGKPADLSDFQPLVGNVKLLFVVLVANWVLAAFGEELVYRGYLMSRVAGLAGGEPMARALSLVAVSAFFGWGHVDQGLTGQIQAGLDGFFLGLLYLGARRNLVAPIVAHGVSNTMAFVLIYLGRYPGL